MEEEEMQEKEEQEKEKEQEEKGVKRYWVTIILLIIIIILLLLLGYRIILSLASNYVVPSSNVDIFELNCNENCSCSVVDTSVDGDGEETEEEVDGEIELIEGSTESSAVWDTVSKLRIFENALYNYNELIAPESSNVYEFIIRNNTTVNVRYTITFSEENNYNINMMYKLSNSSGSITTDWVTYDNLKMSDVYLASGSSDTYYLEWKWFESDNDTEVGTNTSSYYVLNMNLVGYQV